MTMSVMNGLVGREMTARDGDSAISESPAVFPQSIVDWDEGFAALKRYVAVRGAAVMSPGARAGGVAVGAWVAARRQDYWNGRLDRTRA